MPASPPASPSRAPSSPSLLKKQNVRFPASPMPKGAPAILVTISRCVEKRDQPGGFVLYPGTNLYYVFDVKTGGGSWEIHRRFSEVKKFWETLRPHALAAGAKLEAFPAHSALLTGQGLAGNYYETSPNSPFATQRVELLSRLADQLVTKKNATGGSLFELRLVRAFFEIDEAALVASSSASALSDMGLSGDDAADAASSSTGGKAASSTLADERARLADAEAQIAKMAAETKPQDAVAAFMRSTPATFCTVFVAVLTALVLLDA